MKNVTKSDYISMVVKLLEDTLDILFNHFEITKFEKNYILRKINNYMEVK